MPKYFKIEGPFTRDQKRHLDEIQENELVDTFFGALMLEDETYKIWDNNLGGYKNVTRVTGYALDICDRTKQKRPIIGAYITNSKRSYLAFTKFSNNKKMAPIDFRLYQELKTEGTFDFKGYWEDQNETNRKLGFCNAEAILIENELEQAEMANEIKEAMECLFEYFPDRMRKSAQNTLDRQAKIINEEGSLVTGASSQSNLKI